ncbi:MAG: nif-specific transcriptional activator NifA [Thermodesulfobacteriota bacterium]|nr:nif-specific transcriptional activator NifA [Thermodesulfobacteriota bacterium]
MRIDRKTSREIEEITCLYEIARALGASLYLRDSLHSTLDILAKKLGMTRGTITILNPMTSELQIEVAHGLTAEARKRGRYKLGEGITGKVVESGEPMVVPRISEEPLFLNRTRSRGDLAKQDISFICVPIKAARKTVGALSVDRLFQTDVSLDEDLRLLTIISSLIAQTVIKIQTMEKEKELLINENLELRHRLTDKYSISHIVGNSSRMKEVYEMISRVAGSNATVLIRGESGTGKELVANALHYNSRRAHKPFIKVNCSALPETLIESELFGHEKGAFTGAIHQKKGRFELAEGGSIFLDEVGELSQNIQVKLLRVIQEHEFERLGGTQTIHCDVRIIAATNKDLEEALSKGTFREDLYYRLNVFPIHIPPLRERRTDILLLAEHFLERFCRENNKNIRRISTPAIDMLMQYHWPGNVRELQNCMERAILICDEEVIKSYHLPPTLQTPGSSRTHSRLSLAEAVDNTEKEMIIEALKETRGNQSQAAQYLDTSLRILNYKIHKYGLDPKQFKVS